MKYGKLTFIAELSKRSADKHIMWECQCECGNESPYIASRVRNGYVNQCKKCANQKAASKIRTHGKKGTKEYRTWSGIKARCTSKTNKDFYRYGAIGINMHEDWVDSFEAFYAYIGDAPSPKHSIDRIDGSKGYVPGNIRWATHSTQQRNKTCTVYVTNGNSIFHINDVAESLGITRGAAHLRLKRGKLYGYSKV